MKTFLAQQEQLAAARGAATIAGNHCAMEDKLANAEATLAVEEAMAGKSCVPADILAAMADSTHALTNKLAATIKGNGLVRPDELACAELA